jgi:NADPH:quinone reductase
LARLSGFSQIIATAANKHEPLLTKMGATHVIDRSLDDDKQIEKIKSIAPDLQYAWDAICSKDTVAIAARSFGTKGGQIVGSLSVDVRQYPGVSGRGIVGDPLGHAKTADVAWSHLEEMLKKGDFKPLPYTVVGGLSKTAEALQAVKKASGEKILIRPQD